MPCVFNTSFCEFWDLSSTITCGQVRRLNTAGFAENFKLGLHHNFCVRCPISIPRPDLKSSQITTRGTFNYFLKNQYKKMVFFALNTTILHRVEKSGTSFFACLNCFDTKFDNMIHLYFLFRH